MVGLQDDHQLQCAPCSGMKICFHNRRRYIITSDEVVGLEDADEDDPTCALCGGEDSLETMLECDRCLGGFHLHCLDPPLDDIPEVRPALTLSSRA